MKILRMFLIVLMGLLSSGCMHGGSFDCPMTNKPSCKSVTETSEDLDAKGSTARIIFIGGL